MNNITRNTFLKQLGLKGAALMAVYCGSNLLSACKNESNNPTITLDLNDTSYSALKNIGGYVVLADRQLVIAKISSTEYITVSRLCSHDNQLKIIYKTGEFYCEAHMATYNHQGKGTFTYNSNGAKGIQVFPTSVTGNIITITT